MENIQARACIAGGGHSLGNAHYTFSKPLNLVSYANINFHDPKERVQDLFYGIIVRMLLQAEVRWPIANVQN